MSGIGSMLHMVSTYRQNRELLKRIKPFKNIKNAKLSYKKTSVNLKFKEATEEELQIFREKLLREKRKELIKSIFVSIIVLIVFSLLVLFLFKKVGII
jgi:hypothetical protein